MKPLPFSITKELTIDQCKAIDKALEAHKITLDNKSFDWLCERIENALHQYLHNRQFVTESRSDVLRKIARLRNAMTDAQGAAHHVLEEAALHTLTEKIAHQAGLEKEIRQRIERMQYDGTGAFTEATEDVSEALTDRDPGADLFWMAWPLLLEACEIALQESPPESIGTGADIVTAATASSKGGRPPNVAKKELIHTLASEFRVATGRRATDTESGPFDDFLAACLSVVEPVKPDGTTHRKAIREALKHVPKPRRKN